MRVIFTEYEPDTKYSPPLVWEFGPFDCVEIEDCCITGIKDGQKKDIAWREPDSKWYVLGDEIFFTEIRIEA